MHKNPDIYLLYEYMDKIPFTVRMKFYLDSKVDEMLLEKAAQEVFERFPYFSVKVGLDEGQNYTLEHNDKPIAVIPAKEFMDYAKKIDGTPNTILTAMMFKVTSKMFKEKEGTFLAGRIAVDYSKDIGAGLSYRDFIRFVHIRYEWSMKDESIEKLNMRARGAVITQNSPELSYERFRRLVRVHEDTDEQPTLKAKKAFASKNSAFRSDPRATYVISYVGQIDWGGMEEHIKGFYTITDGDLMIEINYLKECFCITFQLVNKDEKPLELFCETLEKENIPFEVSDMYIRNMPRIQLPKC
ncbi:MAG: hypothetical protein K6E91_08925 [Butyrivibrio sp.]|nr:hypothetical protein [Butyrivibrio sp.]